MSKYLIKAGIVWGLVLWGIGFVLSLALFPFVPVWLMGWTVMPIGIVITIWVLFKKIKLESFADYLKVGIIWTLIAVLFDYLFIVKLFNPADGYYKLDVYLYYLLTFVLPVAAGWIKSKNRQGSLTTSV